MPPTKEKYKSKDEPVIPHSNPFAFGRTLEEDE
jgi:hypothetical protein